MYRENKGNKRKCGQTQERTKGAESAYIERTQVYRQVYQGKLCDIDKCSERNRHMDKGGQITDRAI
ncbi:hypothetical protein NEAUS05_2637 [Nematocida ausubeli]|nr:hypothetical protein NEAUS05_2637 [Nematocida ausubeli]